MTAGPIFSWMGTSRRRKTKRSVIERDGRTCRYCSRDVVQDTRQTAPNRLTVDHVVPHRAGGRYSFDNLVVACYACNQFKDDRSPDEAGLQILPAPI